MAKTKVHLTDTNLPVEPTENVKFVVSKNGQYQLETITFPDCCDDVEKLMATWGYYIDIDEGTGQALLDWCGFLSNFISTLTEQGHPAACDVDYMWKSYIQYVYGRERTSGGVDVPNSLVADLVGFFDAVTNTWNNYKYIEGSGGSIASEKSVFKKIFELILAATHTEFNADFKAAIIKLLGCDPCARVSDVEEDVDALMDTWGQYMTAPSGSVPDWTIAWCSFLAVFITQLKTDHSTCGVTADWKNFIQEIYGRERTSGSVAAANSLIADLIGQLQAGAWNNYEEKFDGSVRISEKSVFKKIFELILAGTHTDFNADFKAAIIKLLGCDPCARVSDVEEDVADLDDRCQLIEARLDAIEG